MRQQITIFWFRRDLRLYDNAGLYQALQSPFPVLPLFIFDTELLELLPGDDARVSFIHDTLQQMRIKLQKDHGSSIAIYHGKPRTVFKKVLQEYDVNAVYTNHDYEPYARNRDQGIKELLDAAGVPFRTCKDHVCFEKNEVVKDDGSPYVVFTPYMKKWKEVFAASSQPEIFNTGDTKGTFLCESQLPNLTLSEIGFRPSSIKTPSYSLSAEQIRKYERTRNFPALEGTTRLGPHLRFGTVSVREVHSKARSIKNETFWNELIWREFFMQILWHFPETVHKAFKKKYDRIQWRNREEEFEKWKQGQTGYALVDAGMRQLNRTGYMHNRIRMLTASFLCKHLLIDWRWGEAYFAEKLLDYELSSNIGNWQWAAGSGVDAAPYFRIFNPHTQRVKFDRNEAYIKQWVPEYGTGAYPDKIVAHKEARERCLHAYKAALT